MSRALGNFNLQSYNENKENHRSQTLKSQISAFPIHKTF